MNPQPLDASAIRAVVVTGDTETEYLRAGRGAPVLLLTAHTADLAGSRLFRALARHHRVIAPRPPAAERGAGAATRLSGWLRDVVDGLGLVWPSVVADEEFGLAALAFALGDSGPIPPIAVLLRHHLDSADPNVAVWEMPGEAEAGRPPLLVLADGAAGGEGLTQDQVVELIEFLGGTAEARGGSEAQPG